MFVESGNIVKRRSETLSFEYRFTVRLIMLDFCSVMDLFAVPILAWFQHLPAGPAAERAAKGLRF